MLFSFVALHVAPSFIVEYHRCFFMRSKRSILLWHVHNRMDRPLFRCVLLHPLELAPLHGTPFTLAQAHDDMAQQSIQNNHTQEPTTYCSKPTALHINKSIAPAYRPTATMHKIVMLFFFSFHLQSKWRRVELYRAARRQKILPRCF